MTKADLVSSIAKKTNVSVAATKMVLDAALEEIQAAVESGETVQLMGFGSWSRKLRPERIARNPSTGMPITLPAKNVPVFTFSNAFKDRVKKHQDV